MRGRRVDCRRCINDDHGTAVELLQHKQVAVGSSRGAAPPALTVIKSVRRTNRLKPPEAAHRWRRVLKDGEYPVHALFRHPRGAFPRGVAAEGLGVGRAHPNDGERSLLCRCMEGGRVRQARRRHTWSL